MKNDRSRFCLVVLSVALAASPFASGCVGVCGVEPAQELEPGSEASSDEVLGHEHGDPCGEVVESDNGFAQHPKDCHCPICQSPPQTN
jgi:hypothetical protein